MNTDGRNQMVTVKLLADFIRKGEQNFLHALVWTIGVTGATGKLDVLLGDESGARTRYEFESWAAVLGAEIRPEERAEDGTTHLRAARRFPREQVTIVLRCTLGGAS